MNDLTSPSPVKGLVAPGFEPVAEIFARNFTELHDVGAAFAVVRRGETLLDLWGGQAAPGRPWTEDTLQLIFSGTKGLVGTSVLMLVDRGLLDLDQTVAHYWPEFAAGGKGGVRVRDVVSHQAGLPGIATAELSVADVADDQRMEGLLAAEPLSTDPHAFACYHALTIGWLCGGILRRIDGRSIGRFFAEEIAGPLGLDVYIGVPQALEPRVGRLELEPGWKAWDDGLSPEDAADRTRWSIWGNPPLFPQDLPWNSRLFHAAEIPGGGGIAAARSMAKLYDGLANGGTVGGVRLMGEATLKRGRERRSRFVDYFLDEAMSFGTCYALEPAGGRFGPPGDTFGHSGAGGSIHCAWPSEGLGLSFVMNQLRDDEDRRTKPLLAALKAAIDRL